MDNTCVIVQSEYEQVDDTDKKAMLEEILEAFGCYIEPVKEASTAKSGGAGTKDPDQD